MKKYHCRSVVVAVVFWMILGCGKKASDGDGRKVITFWHSFVANTIPSLNALIQKFEAEHPDIKVHAQYIPTGDALVHKLVTAVQSNTAPDISWIHPDFLDKLVQANAIYAMDEFIKGPDGLAGDHLRDIFPASLEAGKWRGTLYALPMEATSLALLYNKRLFQNVGIDPNSPPRTWEELQKYAKQLTLDTNGDGTIDQYGFFVPVFPASGELNIWMNLQWAPFLWQAGGEEINDDQTTVLFNSVAGVAALELWKTIYDELSFGRFGLSHDIGFASQKVAMIMDGPWNLPRYRELKDFEWGVAPLPAGPVRRATYIAGEQLAIFKQSKHPKEAWTFVKWVLEPRIQAFFSMESGYLPVRKSVLHMAEYKKFLLKDAALKAFVDQMSVGRARRQISYHWVEINRLLAEAIEKATLGKMDPKEVLDEAARQADALLRKAQPK